MYLQKLSVIHYKNIEEATLDFSPRLNCFFGRNGQGKTNLLDAIYYLSFCKSHSNPIDSQNILHDADFLVLQGEYIKDERPVEYYCGIKRKQKKVFKHDKKIYERLSEHIGQIPLVIISPADEALIREGSDDRRRFLDMTIAQSDPAYTAALVAYNKALAQRNALLKNEQMSREPSLFDVYDAQLSEHADFIYRKRKEFVEDFIPVFNRYDRLISGKDEQVSLAYHSHLDDGDLENQLKRNREKDLILGFTTHGIHKDDLDMTMDGYPIKRVGSQGQNKSYLIALKLAQYDFLKNAVGQAPILLLDDLFDKLDSHRVENLLSIVSSDSFGQIFITDTHFDFFSDYLGRFEKGYKLFQIEQGKIESYPTGDARSAL